MMPCHQIRDVRTDGTRDFLMGRLICVRGLVERVIGESIG